jgi:hypothetical protein
VPSTPAEGSDGMARPALAAGPRWALAGLAGGAEADRVEPKGSTQIGYDKILFFSLFLKYFQAQKQIRKFQKMLTRHEKYSENPKNSRKIPRARLEHEQSK